MSDPTPLVALRGIHKRFGDVVANEDVTLDVLPGEVHAILGENGAGKTTLMRILYGLSTADRGTIEVHGRPVSIGSPKDALRHGIGMVTQHFALVGPMTVIDNVLLTSSGLGPLDRRAARERVLEVVDHLGVSINPDAVVEELSVGEQQRVEIIKALYQGAKVLILDEPTAVLVPQESQALLDAVRRLTAEGLGVVFISHKLHEVAAISQRVSVLRHGRIVSTMPTAGASPAELAELMVGRSVAAVLREERRVTTTVTADDAPPLLKVESLSLAGESGAKPLLHDIALTVRSGEILALAGVSGNGQRELADVLSGVRRPTTGSVTLDGTDITHATPRGLLEAGLGRIPEDRHGSVIPDLSVAENLVIEELDRFRRGPFLDHAGIRRHAEGLIERFAIKAAPQDRIGGLSGGNMQKVLLARVLAREPKAIVVAQPTRGLDVGAGEYVHQQLLERRADGAAILLMSEDLDEVHALADRIAVIFEGEIMGVVDAEQTSRADLGLMMAGMRASDLPSPDRQAPAHPSRGASEPVPGEGSTP